MSNDDKAKGGISRVTAEAADGALGLASKLAERLRSTDKSNNSEHASQSKSDTSAGSPRSKTDRNDSTPDGTTADLAASTSTGIKEKNFECSVNYWRAGLKLPESGKIHLDSHQFAFKGITGTKLSFDWESLEVEKASRMGLDGHVEHAYLFTTILKDRKLVFEKIQQAISNATNRPKHAAPQDVDNETKKVKQPPIQMPPDLIMQKMTSIGCESLKGVSLQDYYEVSWSEGQNSDKPPMYGPFLTDCGKDNVVVNPWEEGDIKGDWCRESYTHQRFVTFNFMKQTIGQTLVQVKHTQRYRRLGNDRCIVHMTLEMKGFPYADCFVVEVRHVASRSGDNDLKVEIGMFVRFLKGCLFEGKIRNNTGAETSKVQLDLLQRIVEGCKVYAKEIEAEPGEAEPEESENTEFIFSEDEDVSNDISYWSPQDTSKANVVTNHQEQLSTKLSSTLHVVIAVVTAIFQKFVQTLVRPFLSKHHQPATVDEALHDVRQRIHLLKEITLKSVSDDDRAEVRHEIKAIEESLDNIEHMAEVVDDA